MLALLNNKWLFWLILSIPGIPLLRDFYYDDRYYAELMYSSGTWSVQFLVLALAITPFRLWVKKHGRNKQYSHVIRWLIQRRRPIGVAAFAYGAIHTAFYIRRIADLEAILLGLKHIDLLLGWLAMLLFLLLAITSNNYSVHKLGARWQSLHRWVYIATIFTFTHWLYFDFFYGKIYVLFIPLVLIQIYRVWLDRKPTARQIS